MRMILRYGILAVASCLFMLVVGCGKKAEDKPAGGDSAAAAAAPAGGDATGEANVAKAREAIDRIFNKGEMAAVDELFAADFVEHNPSPDQEPGVAGFKKWLADWRAGFPDMKMTIDDIFASGDKVVMRSTMTGTNSGPMTGMPATNKPIKVEVIDIIRMKDGKAVEHWGQIDAMGMMTQLGMMPPMDGHDAAKGSEAAAGSTDSRSGGSGTGDKADAHKAGHGAGNGKAAGGTGEKGESAFPLRPNKNPKGSDDEKGGFLKPNTNP